MTRRGLEFSKSVKLAMFKRAGGPGNLHCEKCKLRIGGKPFDYDHTIELWELGAELREKFAEDGVPAEYGQLICKPCHSQKTGQKTGERAHGKRIVEKAAKVKKRSSFQANRDGKFKKKMDGTVIER
jgi:hypothetical protein